MITKELINYKDFGNAVKISDGITEVIVTVDIGPRIIRYGFVGGENLLNDTYHKSEEKMSGKTFDEYYYKGAYWYNYGGQRLWFSPESTPGSYYPDNEKVEYRFLDTGAVFTPLPQISNNVAYKITVEYDGQKVKVTSTIKNTAKTPRRFAVWAIAVSALNGIEIIPFNTKDTGLLHNRQISVWPYTDLRDERIYFGHKYATITQKNINKPLKLGFNLNKQHVFYALNGTVMKHEYPVREGGVYPDNNVSFETYSCKDFTEVEALSELKEVNPDENLSLVQYWSLYKTDKDFNQKDDDSIDAFIKSLE